MRLGTRAVAAALCVMVLLPGYVRAEVDDPGAPQYTNSILGGFRTPVIEPGDDFEFSFNVTNSYGFNNNMTDVRLTIGVYRYATEERIRNVTEDFKKPPLIEGVSPEMSYELGAITFGETVRVNLTIETKKDTPHGSYFSQSTYFVRFNMTFTFEDDDSLVVLKSRGCFTDQEWDNITSFEPGEEIVNRTYMKSLGVDGLLPDSSFGIKVPIPTWPLGVIVAGCAGLSLMALYYFTMDNPGKYPGLEKRFYYLRGKLQESWGKLKDRRRK
ncbi:MAG: hypothetical protein MUC90_01240 [Thermoplasmata archaeon]|jgi:hypothetical protein|nr:hypothetical protein [Thermoplasmata archaeon]